MRAALILVGGIFKYRKMNIQRDYYDVLGPDWRPTKEQPSTIVSNHSAWMDILLGCLAFNFPRFTSKVGIKNWPLVGIMSSYSGYNTLFVDRAGSKEER